MSNEKQINANRENGKKGGVKTARGKSISCQNSLKHGLLSKDIFVHGENPDEFQELLSVLEFDFNPRGKLEELVVERIALGFWKLRRADRVEAGLLTLLKMQGVAWGALKESEVYEEKHDMAEEMLGAIRPITILDEKRHGAAIQRVREAEAGQRGELPSIARFFISNESNIGNLLHYKTALERGLLRDIHELERLQARWGGDTRPYSVTLGMDDDPGAEEPVKQP